MAGKSRALLGTGSMKHLSWEEPRWGKAEADVQDHMPAHAAWASKEAAQRINQTFVTHKKYNELQCKGDW